MLSFEAVIIFKSLFKFLILFSLLIWTFHTLSGGPQEVLEHVINIKYQLLLAPNASEITLKSRARNLAHSNNARTLENQIMDIKQITFGKIVGSQPELLYMIRDKFGLFQLTYLSHYDYLLTEKF